MVGDKQKLVIDTSIFMEDLSLVKNLMNDYLVCIPYVILQELDNLKTSHDHNKAYKARNASRFINDNKDNFKFAEITEINGIINDDLIIKTAKLNKCSIATNDIYMKIKATAMNIDIVEVDSVQQDDYKGYKELCIDEDGNNEILANIYKDRTLNTLGLLTNEYLLVKDRSGKVVDKMRYTKDGFVGFNNKTLNSKIIGGVKPLDEYQSCLIDSLVNDKMSMVKGKAGSGKTLISLTYAFSMIEKGKYNKLIIFANPVNSRNSARLGYYPGTRDEKMLDSFVGSMLTSKLGGMEGVYQLIDSDKLELLPFSDIRGYDTSGMNVIVYIVEAQNLSVDLMKLAIQRVADGCKLIIDGDYNTQVDMSAYEGSQNGMRRVSEVFRGQDFYGEVELNHIYRSEMAKIADKM